MNVNLADPTAREIAAGDIDNHLISMATANYPVTGQHLLFPVGRQYPGAYQVWLQIASKDLRNTGWIYVDPDGVVKHREYPGAEVKVPTDG